MKKMNEICLGILSLSVFSSIIGYIIYTEKERHEIFTQFKHYADTDSSGLILDNEWKAVYEKLGKQYDNIKSEPLWDFSFDEMEKYIEKQKK